jgi:hypothetical protein
MDGCIALTAANIGRGLKTLPSACHVIIVMHGEHSAVPALAVHGAQAKEVLETATHKILQSSHARSSRDIQGLRMLEAKHTLLSAIFPHSIHWLHRHIAGLTIGIVVSQG